jgi:hypothetical protein
LYAVTLTHVARPQGVQQEPERGAGTPSNVPEGDEEASQYQALQEKYKELSKSCELKTVIGILSF